ncbi:alanine racemase domain protein [Rickettsia felis str. Pedreira]|uniref:Alanine racemase domain protein n=1 Tax=Rickettsia felis str. Pedreira TaxID=1359196 RepID=A0A0F3MRQ7_RICFI|nr:alanine racemase domain protein [Rickettsia felis str. Pedreira]
MTFLRSRGLVAWLGFSLLREELRSNSTKQSSKNSDLQNFFIIFSGLPRRFAPRNDKLVSA